MECLCTIGKMERKKSLLEIDIVLHFIGHYASNKNKKKIKKKKLKFLENYTCTVP
jgi:uncharacterized pyridoxal phosphate-containing UPF0001 family protein